VKRATWLTGFAAACFGALATLTTIWSIGPTTPAVERQIVLRAGFASPTMEIVDQLGTVDVSLWVKNVGRSDLTATCAVIVTSGTGQRHHQYRGSAAFSLASMRHDQLDHVTEVVTGVYYDGDATGPIGSRNLPLPQYARLGIGSRVVCSGVAVT